MLTQIKELYQTVKDMWYNEYYNQKETIPTTKDNLTVIDFEVAINDRFPEPQVADTPIISVVMTSDNKNLTTICYTTHLVTEIVKNRVEEMVNTHLQRFNQNVKIEVIVVQMNSERQLLTEYLKTIKNKPLISGWNLEGFDMPYLINRLRRYNLDLKTTSPINQIDHRGWPQNKKIIDYMIAFQRYADYQLNIKPQSYQLSYILQKFLGIERFDYVSFSIPATKEPILGETARSLASNCIHTISIQLLHRQYNALAAEIYIKNRLTNYLQ